MSRQQLKEKGFTIIEVVLVLAIAALIFLMVFIALPALQRTQRDDARKRDIATISSAMQAWMGNNRSGWPEASALSTYIGEDVSENTVTNPDDKDAPFIVDSFGNEPDAVAESQVIVVTGAACSTVEGDGKFTLQAGTKRQYVVVTRLESGGGSAYCLPS